MASKFQNRLVGTLVLVAIGVIFLPDVLDGKKEHYQESYDSIPLKPEVDEEFSVEDLQEPEQSDAVLPQEPVSVKVEDDVVEESKPESVESASPEKTALNDSAWVIRLGTFRNQDNAKKLVENLRGKGYQAHIMPRDLKPGDLAKVVVGPDVSKEKLEGMLTDLESLTGLKGQLRRFNPLSS